MKTLLACVLLMTVISGCSKDCEDDPNDCEINLNQGLVAYYPFNGNADDASGNGNNGVVYGATFTTDFLGRPGKAAGFDGINDYILVNDNGKLNHQEVTIAMMVMVNNTNRRQAIINRVDFETAKGPVYGVGQALDATNKWEFSLINQDCNTPYAYNPNDYATSTETLQPGRWYHLIATFSKGVQKLYIDGALRVTKTRDFSTLNHCPGVDLVIGAWWKNDIVSIDGKVDELRIYNRAFTDCEIEKLTEIFE
ncbi:MAG TPA: LamG domain-containing protein [Chitinophagaceae bacterium]